MTLSLQPGPFVKALSQKMRISDADGHPKHDHPNHERGRRVRGAGAVWGGIEDKSDMEGFGGLAVFFAGLFLSAATFALRKLQLIEWRLAQGSNQRR
jgi:hypothetical protein